MVDLNSGVHPSPVRGRRGRRTHLASAVVTVAALLCLSVGVGTPAAHALTGTYVVSSVRDIGDASVGDGVCMTVLGTCTLRAAVQEANLDHRASTISFAIAGTGVHTITLTSSLPVLSDQAGGTTINGYSQPGSAVNTHALVDNAVLRVQIRGAGSNGFDAIDITSSHNVVRGLAFYNLRLAVAMAFGGNENVVVGNFIGTNAAGTFKDTVNNGNAFGVLMDQLASRNVIGRPGRADRNVISGNAGRGVMLKDAVVDNMVQNNIIGLAPNGRSRLPNADHGIDVNSGASGTVIGGTATQAGNLISGNDGHGIEVSHPGTSPTYDNKIIGNRIGTDATGNAGPSYARNGDRYAHENVHTEDNVSHTLIAYNIIGNSRLGGIKVDNNSVSTSIRGNRIGISANGTPISNGAYGVQVELGSRNTVIGPNNVIAYNRSGIRLQNNATVGNTITKNAIYGNQRLGIDIAPLDVVNGASVRTATNRNMHYPVISRGTASTVSGRACASCLVEVFLSDSSSVVPGREASYGEGRTYLGSARASGSGAFTVRIPTSTRRRSVTATATSTAKNTSEFARNVIIPGPAPAPK